MPRKQATTEQREYLTSLSSKLATLLCAGDPTASRIAREAVIGPMEYNYAKRLIQSAEDAIRALEGGNVVVGPWGEKYDQGSA